MIRTIIMYHKINNKYMRIVLEAQEWINTHITTYTESGISIIDWDEFSDPRNLLDILQGEDK